MSWVDQAKIFFKELSETREKKDVEEEKVTTEDMEFVSSASEARLLAAPTGASFLVMLTFVCLTAIIVWSLVMQVDEVAKSQGKVIPSKQVQVIQNLEGGIVKEISVVEGQNVKKGDVLVVIDDVYAKSDVDSNVNAYNALLARLVCLNAGLAEKRIVKFPAELQAQIEIISQARKQFHADWESMISKVKELEFAIEQGNREYENTQSEKKSRYESYKLFKEELELNEPLVKSGAISKVELLKIKQRVNEEHSKYLQAKIAVPRAKAALSEAMQNRESFIGESRASYEKERNEIKEKLNVMQSKGVSLQAKLSHSIVKSPVVGTVKKINFTTVGGVIRPGMDILEIVPTDDKLLIEVKVKPKDIGFIERGQKANVKITAFDFSTYGGLEGKVVFISADTITDKKGNSFYLARIRTDSNIIVDKKGKKHTIIPGRRTKVDIRLDKKSILTYILKRM